MRDHPTPGDRLAPSDTRDAIRVRLGFCALACMALIAATRPVFQTSLPALLAASGAFLLAAALVALCMDRSYPHPRMGACNATTLARAALVASLLMPLADGHAAGYAIAFVATVALVLDGADGWLARRSGLTSRFGARFDIEVDAALALMLSLHALAGTSVGAEVLVLGLIRYAFVLAGRVWPWLRGDLAPSRRRKLICVLQIAALIALQVPDLPPDAAILLARGAAVALAWSFAIDIAALRARALALGHAP
ncbi:CDP-alcohol phosphatidyltransferase family protein [Paracoccus fontiphilus]|uniref:CDP-alcohol phosphatidyltransferase family protein n=1 Tax=Paracoccus fontiphilus TaxID=1815556 RepID=A0ABV7IG58_9RHOB|nr:CDP-alcohol phosphatidyltransferase family protein [Paracoccus fontiphilus]